MKEPPIKKQIDDSYKQYKAGLITKDEHQAQLARIVERYDNWVKRDER